MRTRQGVSFLAVALVAFTACEPDLPSGDAWSDTADLTQDLGLACGSAQICSGSATGPNEVYRSTYRVGTTATSSGELLQTFVATLVGVPSSVRLQARVLRKFTPASGQTVLLHADLYAVSNAAAPQLTGSPIATGGFDLQALPATGVVDVPLSASGPLALGGTYALVVTADGIGTGGSGDTLIGIAALLEPATTTGTSFRRSLRRSTPSSQWGESRFRPAGTWDLAFALSLSTTPTAPLDVTAIAGNASATVSWNPPTIAGGSPVSGYTVVASPGGTPQTTANGTTTQLVYTGLMNGTAYTFTLQASNAQGAGPVSAPSAPVVPRTVPGAPQSLAVTGHTGFLSLTWSAPASTGGASITGYEIREASASTGPFVAIATVVTTAYDVFPVAAGERRWYVVAATNVAGTGTESAAADAITSPPAPTGLSAIGGVGSVSLSWNPANGASAYLVRRSSTTGTGFSTIATVPSPSYLDTGCGSGQTCFYEIVATNETGSAPASAEANALTAPPAPASPGASGTNSQITLLWSASAGASGYAVQRSTTAGSGHATIASVTTSPYVETPPAAGVTYYYVVRATNASGTSSASTEVAAVTAPPAPATLGASGTNAQISLTWSASTGATGYQVLRSTTAGSGHATIATVATSPYVDTPPAAGTTYYYVVRATNSAGTSASSPEASAFTAPPAPATLGAGATNGQITLTWSASAGASGYHVLRSTTAGSGHATLATVATSPFVDTPPAAGTAYYYVVRATNVAGSSANSPEATATTAPAAPTNVVVTAASTTQLNVTWTASTGATSYRLRRDSSSGGAFSTIVTTTASTSASDTGLTSGVTYWYEVEAFNAAGSAFSAPASGTTNATCSPNSQIFSTPGSVVLFTFPAGCTQLTIKAWGAGGAGYSSGIGEAGSGGAGGFASGVYTTIPGGTALSVYVGGGGGATGSAAGGAAGWNGGGAGGLGQSSSCGHCRGGGGGGGWSGVRVTNTAQDLVIAGGGGGSSGYLQSGSGGGGGDNGATGTYGNSTNGSPGQGGTQFTGGTGGSAGSGASPGANGTKYQGGAAGAGGSGAAHGSGGGGGGYYGGGGGGGCSGNTGTGGGGGSSYHPNGTTVGATGPSAVNTDSDWGGSGAGAGGGPGGNGANGRVVIKWQ